MEHVLLAVLTLTGERVRERAGRRGGVRERAVRRGGVRSLRLNMCLCVFVCVSVYNWHVCASACAYAWL
jgi:hypothetical protein